MHRLWLIFAQAVTVMLAFMFITATLRPEWLPAKLSTSAPIASSTNKIAEANRPAIAPETPRVSAAGVTSYSDAARKAVPSVVNIFTSKTTAKAPQNHPFMNDPMFKKFFGEQYGGSKQQT